MTRSNVISHAPPSTQGPANRGIALGLWSVLAIIFLVLIFQINHRITTGHSGDFRHFYFAAGALLDHRDLYDAVPTDVIQKALRRPAGPVELEWYSPANHDRYLYPPMIALLYTPIARLKFETGQWIMLIVNALLMISGVVLTARSFVARFDLHQRSWLVAGAALLGVVLNLDKVHVELQMFQTNALMFFLFALSLYWLDRWPLLAGAPLGMILNIKYLSLGLLPWLVIRRRWGTFSTCIVWAIGFALLPGIVSGWRENAHNLAVAYGGLLHMVGVHGSAEQANVDDIRDYLSCSITSALARTTAPGHSLMVPMICTAGVAGISALIVMGIYRRRGIPIFGPQSRSLRYSEESGPTQTKYFEPHRRRDAEKEIQGETSTSLITDSLKPKSAGVKTLLRSFLSASPRLCGSKFAGSLGPIAAIEFVSIVAATLCFSPQTNTRHLMLVLLVTIPLSALVLGARSNIVRIPAILGGLLIGIGFIFPPGGQSPASHHLAHWWFGIGGQCWCLLLAIFLLVWSGATQVLCRPFANGEEHSNVTQAAGPC